MHSRAARLMLCVLFLAALSVTAFLFWKGETQAASGSAQAKSFDAASRYAERTLLDVRTAQQAYVAAGQGGEFWAGKVVHGIESLRSTLKSMKAQATAPETRRAIDAAGSTLEDFARIDKRAQDYVRTNQRLLASDVIFADGLELTEAGLTSIEQARTAELEAREGLVGTFRARQTFAVTAGAAAAVLAVVLLLPVPSASARAASLAGAAARGSAPRQPELPKAEPARVTEGEGWSAPRRTPAKSDQPEPAVDAPSPEPVVVEPAIETLPMSETPSVEQTPPALPGADFVGVAALCLDLARIVDTRALPSLLDRAAHLLDASGIILWIADPDGRELNPIFAQGYPQQLLNRLGTIPRDSENATAAAFRTSLLQTVKADDISAGAIAAPLVTPAGCVGVMAAEVRHDAERQDAMLAAATIVAAQLATLVGPPSARAQAKTGSAGA
jgi:hypothetical protein